jgi:hypothetical protein
MRAKGSRFIVGRDSNIVRVDFTREPDPPAPRFPGAAGLRMAARLAIAAIGDVGGDQISHPQAA